MEPTGRREAPPDDRLRAIRDNDLGWRGLPYQQLKAHALAPSMKSAAAKTSPPNAAGKIKGGDARTTSVDAISSIRGPTLRS
jgi:hypothetical protein